MAVRYGLPAPFLLLLAFLSIFLAVGFKKGLDDKITAYRTAFLITMTAFFMVGWTVHFWDAAYVLFLFLMGSGVWMLDVRPRREPPWRRRVFEPRRHRRTSWSTVLSPINSRRDEQCRGHGTRLCEKSALDQPATTPPPNRSREIQDHFLVAGEQKGRFVWDSQVSGVLIQDDGWNGGQHADGATLFP